MRDKLKDFSDWLFEWISVLMLPFIILIIIVGGIGIVVCINQDIQTDEQIKQCFMEQMEDTPECKYLIYKRNRACKSQSNSNVVPIIMHR